ncbi:MAG TPA: phenylalanine--tRNA ligase subunit beta [Candidatus Paceibacterota bacterium]|nr:phenylalanine--tRNA ligase subunit beta [Candidatus Paceibacterota bacterium]
MKFSYSWLQSYFDTPLPDAETLSSRITNQLAEVDGVEKIPNSNHTLIDIKVLPDRAGYLLSHASMAREIGAILGVSTVKSVLIQVPTVSYVNVPVYPLQVQSGACSTYIAIEGTVAEVANIEVYDRIKDALASVGQRSINPLVDIANLVMLDIGQPMHVFDAHKLDGTIVVRSAQKGESMTTLDGKELSLTQDDLVIADNSSVLGLAGIKGGRKAEAGLDTTHFIFESANFDATSIRKSGQAHGIKTDASKRFENAISSYWTTVAMEYAMALVQAVYGTVTIVSYGQHGTPAVGSVFKTVSSKEIFRFLGVPVSDEQCISTAHIFGWECEKKDDKLLWHVPVWRNDMVIDQDFVEEVGRIIGYEEITPVVPEVQSVSTTKIASVWQFLEILKNELVGVGAHEILAYSLVPSGELEVLSAPSPQRMKLRSSLVQYVAAEAEKNARNGDLLRMDPVIVFEIGSVFTLHGESLWLAVAVSSARQKAKVVTAKAEEILSVISQKIQAMIPTVSITTTIETKEKTASFEIPLDELVAIVKEKNIATEPLQTVIHPMEKYQPFSPYPYIVRDIAVLVPTGQTDEKIISSIKHRAGELAVHSSLFDVFEKKDSGQTSYGYRVVFQSHEKTLLAEDIDAIMADISKDMTEAGFVVR